MLNANTCEIAQPRAHRLARLQVLVRHRAQRRQAVLEREVDVAGADELRADAALSVRTHLVLPAPREPPPGAVIGDPELGVRHRVDLLDLGARAAAGPPSRSGAAACCRKYTSLTIASTGTSNRIVCSHGPLIAMSISPGAAAERPDLDEPLVELEQAEQVDEVALQEAPASAGNRARARREAQRAQRAVISRSIWPDVGRQVDARRAALEAVFDLRRREVMQHDLHHRELVEVGVEQRLDDHAGSVAGGGPPGTPCYLGSVSPWRL